MKKVMVALGAVAFAAIAQAASMNWSTCGEVADPSGNPCGGEGYVTMYLFSIDAATYAALTADGVGGVSSAVWDAYKSSLGSADGTYVDDGMGQFVLTDPNTYGAGDTAYAAVVMAYDDGTGISYYKGNVGSYTFDADVDVTIENMDTVVFGGENTTALAWADASGGGSVPEPTSGLLLLLGVAGLALRRKN